MRAEPGEDETGELTPAQVERLRRIVRRALAEAMASRDPHDPDDRPPVR